jgi:hypothetical protein
LRLAVKSAQVSVKRVARSTVKKPISSANDSLSHRSSHHRMVTRSPNHMWLISCAITIARCRRLSSVVRDRKTNISANVTAPGFSIAPALNSGTNSWS